MLRIVWHVTVSGTWRSIIAAILLAWACFVALPALLKTRSCFLGAHVVKGMWTTLQKIIFPDYFLFFLPLYKSYVYFLLWFQDTGKLNVSYFRFDINDATGDLDANRPVPFRLTPNISEFLTTIGVSGPLTASMIAVARCFAQPNFKVPRLLSFFFLNTLHSVSERLFKVMGNRHRSLQWTWN